MTGRPAVRSTIEQALRLDLDQLLRRGVVRPGEHLAGDLRLEFFDDDLVVEFESRTWDTGGWLRLQYAIPDYQTGEPIEIDDQVRLTTTTPPNIGGRRYWFVCPRSSCRARKLYLPLGGRHFWSRQAYGLAYASQREDAHDRALRRVAKLCRRLGADPADGEYPDKPKRMRWTTYNLILAELDAAQRAVDGADHHQLQRLRSAGR